jgi:hypothetical protein
MMFSEMLSEINLVYSAQALIFIQAACIIRNLHYRIKQ